MKKSLLIVFMLIITLKSLGWGAIGHRIVGLIAQRHLTEKAKKNIAIVLGTNTLAEVSNYMDFIKSDNSYRHTFPWHYVTIPDGKLYSEVGTLNKGGDIIATIQRLIREFKSKSFTDADEVFALKCLIHLIGDIHQPLHVGNGKDKGGNSVRLGYFRKKTNLHTIWDSEMINGQRYSYTEYANWIDHPTEDQLSTWSSQNVLNWANESKEYRNQCYKTIPENNELSYRYVSENIDLLNQRLLQAGIRLANVLNAIYGV